MNTNKKNIALNNGWILCPSKTFPGKFYYFNVLNGETAWSLNEADKKCLRKDTAIADKSHDYPEPTSLPDDSAIGPQVTCHIGPNFQKPNIVKTISCNEHLSTFGKASFPNYVANTDTLMPNIVWTPVQLPMPMPMFCPQTKQPMFDKVTQTSELERQLFTQTCDIPLCKRFKNYENPSLCFENNKIVNKSVYYFDTSTPKSSYIDNRTPSLNHIPKSNFLYKEPILKFKSELPDTKTSEIIENNAKSTLHHGNRVESSKMNNLVPKIAEKDEGLGSLDKTDLRFLLLAKKRMSVDAAEDAVVERKKPKPDVPHVTPKKVTFDLSDISDDETGLSDVTIQEKFIPHTPEHTTDYTIHPRSPMLVHKDTSSTPITGSNVYIENPKELPTMCRQKDTAVSMVPNDTWYIVVDTDVLLLDKDFVDELVLSDKNCKLLIPHAVRADVAALCVGDCRGQQRVMNARHITRRLAIPPPHYIVEPEPDHEEDIVVTTDSILQCCVNAVNDNRYVVLITNDPYLQSKASSLHIPNYKLNEIKNGVTKPEMTSELNKIKIQIPNEESRQNNMYIQNKNELGLFSNKSQTDTVKKQLIFNNGNDTDINILDCDKLINITKPKSLKNNDIFSKCDNESDINKKLRNLNLRDRNILRSQNIVSNTSKDSFDFEKTVPNSKLDIKNTFTKSNHDMHRFEKGLSMKNSDSTENMFNSNHLSNIKRLFQNPPTSKNDCNTRIENYEISFDTKPSYESNRETKIITATQSRLQKMFKNINFETNNQIENKEQIPKTNDPTGIFKIPQPLLFKIRTRDKSDGSSAANDKIRTRNFQSTDSADDILKRFYVKSKDMSQKLSTRMDEWICSFIQIMEDVLNRILLNNRECMKNTVAPLTLHDTLNCIKMLYDSHTKVRDAIDKISDLINRCISKKDKYKPPLNPDQFMKMFGYGVLLILSLEEIIPQSEDLMDAGTRLSTLISNIESTAVEVDPESQKPSIPSSADVDTRYEELRPNFSKEPSYIINYLKKHYKAWATCNENSYNDISRPHNRSNVKVLRTFGKNINLLKFDNSKEMSLSKTTIEADSTKKCEKKPEIISFIEVDQINKPTEKNVDKNVCKDQTMFMKNTEKNNEDYIKSKYFTTNVKSDQKTDVLKVMKHTNKTGQDLKNIEEIGFPNPGHTFMQNAEKAGPKMIRNMKLIDEYEKRIKNKEPLDLDLLDYSETYEPSISVNLQSDNVYDNSECRIANNELNNTKITLSDSTEDMDLGNKSLHMSPILEFKNYSYKKLEENMSNKIEQKNDYNYCLISGTETTKNNKNNNETIIRDKYIDNIANKNDSCIDNSGIHHDISEIHADISEIGPDNFGIHHDISGIHADISEIGPDNFGIHHDISGIHHDISEIGPDNFGIHTDNGNFDKLAPARDDSTNDSGFENDSTYAHSVVKMFLHELSTSFKVIYEFVNKFIIELHDIESCELKKNNLHNQARKSLEDMAAIIQRLRSIIKRESAEDTVLRTLLLKAGLEATTDKRMTRYKQIVMKSLEQALILENALRIITSTTRGDFDFDAISTNAHSINSSKVAVKYFNIFEQP